jgi:hypothetical protein
LLDADQHPAAINGSCRQANNLADPQTRPVCSGQGDAVAQTGHRFKEPRDLLGAQHHGQPLRFPCRDDLLVCIAAAQGDAIEEAQGANCLVDMRPRPLLRDQM